jgi:hypothetical protein
MTPDLHAKNLPAQSSHSVARSILGHAVLALDEPHILVLGAGADDLAAWRIGGPIGHPLDPERWAEERQYSARVSIFDAVA